MLRNLLSFSLAFGIAFAVPYDANAARKKGGNKRAPAPTVITPENDGYYVKLKKKNVYCYQDTNPGTTKTLKDGRVAFTSFQTALKKAKKTGNRAAVANFLRLIKEGKKAATS